MTPTAELLDLPREYGKPKKPLDWTAVRQDLERATAYWLATVRADGRPHTVPLDGLWVDDVWFYGGSDGLRNEPSAYAEVLALYPRRVLAWTAFPKDATGFTFR